MVYEEMRKRCMPEEQSWKRQYPNAKEQLEEMSPKDRAKYWDIGQNQYLRLKPMLENVENAEVLRLLVEYRRELGHNPSQKEVFPPYRYLIRDRFKNWPTALRAAGLKSAKGEKK